MLTLLLAKQKFILGAALSMSGVFLTFIIRLLIVRAFGVETLASFAVWQNNVTLGSLIAGLGQQNLIIRRFSTANVDQKRGTLAAQITLIVGLTSLASVIVFAALWAFAKMTNAPDFSVTFWSLPAIIIWGLLIVIAPVHRSIGSFYAGLSVDRVIPRILFLLVLLVLGATVGHSIFDISIWFTAALLVSLGLSLWLLQTYKIGWDISAKSNRRLIKPWLSQLGPFFFGATIAALNARYPILIASYFFAPRELGLVVLLLTFLSLISIPTATLNLVVGPNLRRRIAANPSNTKLRIQYASAAGLLAVLSSVIVAIVYPWFVEPANQLPVQSMMIFAGSLVIAALCNAIIFFQFQAGSRYILNTIGIAVLIIRVILGVLGLNSYGLDGLGLAEIVSNIILLVLLYLFVVRRSA